MAKVCYFTGRKTVSGNNRSHAMNQTKRAVKPNLQKFPSFFYHLYPYLSLL